MQKKKKKIKYKKNQNINFKILPKAHFNNSDRINGFRAFLINVAVIVAQWVDAETILCVQMCFKDEIILLLSLALLVKAIYFRTL